MRFQTLFTWWLKWKTYSKSYNIRRKSWNQHLLEFKHLFPNKSQTPTTAYQKSIYMAMLRYEPPNGLSVQSQVWLESQKRLFAWFITFYTFINRDKNENFPIINFTQLASSLFHKDPDFLLFHFLTLLKSSEKNTWNQQKDQLLLEAMKEQGLKWNEVSRNIFLKSSKQVFLLPKSCRERWLNHLDTSKFKGNWKITEDIAIFKHVVETESKKWSKMIGLLDNKRSQHSIKNRFNTLIAKHKKYKTEKDLKVAARILSQLMRKKGNLLDQELHQERQSGAQLDFNHQQMSSNNEQNQQIKENQSVSLSVAEAEAKILPENIKGSQFEVIVKQQEKVPQEAFAPEIKARPTTQNYYPFENYSYEQDICNYTPQVFDFHQTQLFFYQPIFPLQIPTADTRTRQTRIAQQRKRRKPNNSSQGSLN